jgi:hypothetical protein
MILILGIRKLFLCKNKIFRRKKKIFLSIISVSEKSSNFTTNFAKNNLKKKIKYYERFSTKIAFTL